MIGTVRCVAAYHGEVAQGSRSCVKFEQVQQVLDGAPLRPMRRPRLDSPSRGELSPARDEEKV